VCWAAALVISGQSARAAPPAPREPELAPAPANQAAPSPANTAAADAPAQTSEPTAAEPATSPDRAAQAAYEAALARYDSGDLEGALAAMQQSFALSQRPELLYNLARLEREAARCRAALADYRQYLERVPQGRYRQAAEQAITELAGQCPSADSETAQTHREPAAPPRAVPERAPPPPSKSELRYWTTPRVVAWAAISAGVVSGGGALYFLLSAKAARDDVARSVVLQEMGGGHWDEARQADQHRDLALARVLGGSAAALVTGGTLTLLFSHAPEPSRASAAVVIVPGAVEASYRGTF
jgi:tetratricopeptide (TPR) repeat protein